MELIVIDEISMVRADIIDFIDKVLRVYSRNMREPFGGKQLLLVGDIYQLEPVIKEDERRMLHPYYPTSFFFGARIWREMRLVSIELHKVYRQNDPAFISILDHIRTSDTTDADLRTLNTRVGGTLDTAGGNLAITLSTRRDTVDYINEQRLKQLSGEAVTFYGEVKGEFPDSSLPTPMELEVKPGAQIIFIKNDMDKRWVNGTLGVVEGIDEDEGVLYIVSEDGNEQTCAESGGATCATSSTRKKRKSKKRKLAATYSSPSALPGPSPCTRARD